MFTKDSGLVKVWVSLIILGVYEVEQTPKLSNLKEVVTEVVKEMTGEVADIQPKADAKAEPKAEEKKEAAEEPVDLMAEPSPADLMSGAAL